MKINIPKNPKQKREADKKIKETYPDKVRNKFQKKKLGPQTQVQLISLRQAAELAGVNYRTAWNYSKREDKRFEACKRYPDQLNTHMTRVMYTKGVVRIIKLMKKEGMQKVKRGPTRGKRWKWSEKDKEKLKKQHRESKVEVDEKGKVTISGPRPNLKLADLKNSKKNR